MESASKYYLLLYLAYRFPFILFLVFDIYINKWITMLLVSSGMIENKVMLIMLVCFLSILVIDIVGLLIITISGSVILVFMIMSRYFYELFDNEPQIERRARLKNAHKSLNK